MTRDPLVYLRHIHLCIDRIKEYAQDGRDFFLEDNKTQDAVVRNLEVIGQAVKDLGVDRLLEKQPAIPWRQIAGTRNILAYQYLGVDLALIWNILEKELPALETAIIELAAEQGLDLSSDPEGLRSQSL